jgi:hypothetical protein
MDKVFIDKIIEAAGKEISAAARSRAEAHCSRGCCVLLSESPVSLEFCFLDEAEDDSEQQKDTEYSLRISEDKDAIIPACNGKITPWDEFSFACLLQYRLILDEPRTAVNANSKRYTRKGMITRVLNERREKASKAEYTIKWAKNIYGDHILTNEAGVKYKVFLRDFENETGYSDSADAKYNKLGTTKHIMYAFDALKADKKLFDKLDNTFPFIEIYCDPLNDYKVTWY